MTPAREQIQRIYRAAIAAVDPRTRVSSTLSAATEERALLLDSSRIEIGDAGIFLIALGKAGEAMAEGAVDALGDLIRRGIVVTKTEAHAPIQRFDYFVGSHPVPDERSLEAGEAVLDFAERIPDGALVLCLISGGASALVEALKPGIGLSDLQEITSILLRGGAPIHDLNAVRSRVSRIKGGGLLAVLQHARVVNLIVSDVLGDDLHAIASGPTVEPDTSATAEDVLKQYGATLRLPDRDRPPERGPLATEIVGNLGRALDAAAEEAASIGLRPVVLADRLTGEARELGVTIAAILASTRHDLSPLSPGSCLLAGGETTVTVRGDGKGGRNTEAALAAAMELCGSSRLTAGFLATDGDDGLSDAAGAIVDGATISPDETGTARRALEENDSVGFLTGTDALWRPGATGTNVNDLVIGIVE